jgi:hypothetical protein
VRPVYKPSNAIKKNDLQGVCFLCQVDSIQTPIGPIKIETMSIDVAKCYKMSCFSLFEEYSSDPSENIATISALESELSQLNFHGIVGREKKLYKVAFFGDSISGVNDYSYRGLFLILARTPDSF